MEVLDIKNEPVLWMPIAALSNPLVAGMHKGFGINLNVEDNFFFRHLDFINLDTVDESLANEILSICFSEASARPEPGIVVMAIENHFKVISSSTDDDGCLPMIFNAYLAKVQDVGAENQYYSVYSEVEGQVVADAVAVYSPAENILWNDDEQSSFIL